MNTVINASDITQTTGDYQRQVVRTAAPSLSKETMLFFATADRRHSSFYTGTGTRRGKRVPRRHMVNNN